MAKRNKPPNEFDLEGMINHLERENYGEPLSVFENVILLEEGPDEKRQYVFTLFWLSKDSRLFFALAFRTEAELRKICDELHIQWRDK